MDHGIKEKAERFKALAEIFHKESKRVFIKDFENNYYFANIIHVGEDSIEIICFAPDDRKNEKFELYWVNISVFSEYREIGGEDGN